MIALRYSLRTPEPIGRKPQDISAFALLTTVYSDSILLDFTNWDFSKNSLIVVPGDESRSDGLNRMVSERNKAVLVIEQMGSETEFPNATHISGSRGLGFNLTTQYDISLNGDFLPYTHQEAQALVMALVVEARDYQLLASRMTLCNAPLLKAGYEDDAGSPLENRTQALSWSALVGDICG